MSNRPTKLFLVEYYHDGCTWGEEIHAYDYADAEARVKKLGNMRLLGEHIMTIPAVAGGRFLVPALCAIRNWWARLWN